MEEIDALLLHQRPSNVVCIPQEFRLFGCTVVLLGPVVMLCVITSTYGWTSFLLSTPLCSTYTLPLVPYLDYPLVTHVY